jgi:1-acyl-sn-glycerol-3-phosphate acyltransferase
VLRPGKNGRWFQLLAGIVKPFLWSFTRPDWHALDTVPAQGGVLLVANHVTVLDPLTLSHAVYDGAHRMPRFLAKSEIFAVPVIGYLLRRGGQIPVYRRTRDARTSLRDAETALRDGECVIIYPEGTCTADPQGWPMVSKTGVARLAMAGDAPVIPVAHWGAHRILGYHEKRPHLFPRKRIQVIAGEPIDLSRYRGVDLTPDLLREITDLMMSRVAALLGELRGEKPPPRPYDPREHAEPEAAEAHAVEPHAVEPQAGEPEAGEAQEGDPQDADTRAAG